MQPNVVHTPDFVNSATQMILEKAEEAIASQGWFRLSLCGGGTPKDIYANLAAIGKDLPWHQFIITFGDERCVPPGHEDSNFLMASRALLDQVPIPPENVLRMRGEMKPAEAAQDYENALGEVAQRTGLTPFTHDLLLLGMGGDGHTASLFPGSKALRETERRVVANYVEKFESWRLTMTYPLINAAREVCFLIKGDDKAAVAKAVINGDEQYPAAKVRPTSGKLTFLLG
jgi:6-phosphogluconolactonase